MYIVICFKQKYGDFIFKMILLYVYYWGDDKNSRDKKLQVGLGVVKIQYFMF